MFMFRFFSKKLSFGAKSTAVEILYLMKDLHRDAQVPALYAYPGGGRYDSNNIIDKDILVSRLSKVILDAIDYDQYKNLSTFEKDNIKIAIAKYLYLESAEYESSYYEESEDAWSDFHLEKTKGISFSIRFKGYPLDEAYQVNFPKEFFSNQPLLKNCIYAALNEHPDILRKNENISLNLRAC